MNNKNNTRIICVFKPKSNCFAFVTHANKYEDKEYNEQCLQKCMWNGTNHVWADINQQWLDKKLGKQKQKHKKKPQKKNEFV